MDVGLPTLVAAWPCPAAGWAQHVR